MNRNSFEFTKLLFAAFISQTGSHLLTLSLSAFVYVQTGSIVYSSIVYVVSFLPAIFVSSKLGVLVDYKISRSFLIKNEILSACLTLICGLAIYYKLSLIVLCFLLSIRSILSFVSRSSMNKWIKCISTPEQQVHRFKLFSFVFFVSTAISGLLAAIILESRSIQTVIVFDIITYIFGCFIIYNFKNLQVQVVPDKVDNSQIPTVIYSILQSDRLRLYFLLVCFTQALFQGAYSSLVSYLPLVRFSLGMSGVGYFQIAASFGIILGFLSLWIFPNLIRGKEGKLSVLTALTVITGFIALWSATALTSLQAVLVAFFILNFLYEIVWLFASSEFFRAVPAQATGRFTFALSAYAALLMSLSTLAFSAFLQRQSPQIAALSLLLFDSIFLLGLDSCLKRTMPRRILETSG